MEDREARVITVTMPPEYQRLLKQLADRESRSMSAELRHLLDRRAIELRLEPANPLLKGELLTE